MRRIILLSSFFFSNFEGSLVSSLCNVRVTMWQQQLLENGQGWKNKRFLIDHLTPFLILFQS
jgi:hypothetical protein